MTQPLNESVERVQRLLRQKGHANEVVQLPDSARTAKEAADAIGCEIAQIAKSVIFRLERSGAPLLVVASGINRVNEKHISGMIDDTLGKADAAFVRERTGFVIGGGSPLGHSEPLATLIDEDLFQYKTLWAAAGHPKAVFELTADELVEMTGGRVVCVK